jgi:uncharacterized iron-regulated membrane protein
MRSRFEEYQEDDHLDEPVTITGRQLKSLKRAATTGLIATILAIIAVGLGAWNLVQAGKSSTSETMSPEPAAQAQPVPAPVATDSMSTPAPQPIQTGAAPATQPPSTPPATAAKPTAERHAAATKATSARHSHSSTSSTPSGEEPLTVPAFSPSAAPVSPAAPAPTPVAPTKSAGADTSGH